MGCCNDDHTQRYISFLECGTLPVFLEEPVEHHSRHHLIDLIYRCTCMLAKILLFFRVHGSGGATSDQCLVRHPEVAGHLRQHTLHTCTARDLGFNQGVVVGIFLNFLNQGVVPRYRIC